MWLWWLSSEARDHALVDLAGDAHVVEVVFADEIELAGLVEIEHLAAFNFRRLARLDPQRPGDVVETDKTFCSQPPAVHRVENSARRVVGEIHKGTRLERVRKAALKDERQIEADDIVAHELVAITIEVLHEVQ